MAKYEAFSGTADTQLTLTGVKKLVFNEDAGTPGTAEVNFRDGSVTGVIIDHHELAASEEVTVDFGDGVDLAAGALYVDMVSGNIRGVAIGY